jgi:hypothetical protein
VEILIFMVTSHRRGRCSLVNVTDRESSSRHHPADQQGLLVRMESSAPSIRPDLVRALVPITLPRGLTNTNLHLCGGRLRKRGPECRDMWGD